MNIKLRNIPKFLNGNYFPTWEELPSLKDLPNWDGLENSIPLLNKLWELENPKNNPPSLGTIKYSGILTLNPNRNNIYFNGDWNNYHNWHSKRIVMPWLYNIEENTAKSTDWESKIKDTLDSWNNAGGFLWLNANPEQRLHGMLSDQTKAHLDIYYYDPLLKLEDNMIGIQKAAGAYKIPKKANTYDVFDDETKKRVGRNGIFSDSDFGIQTGNRRPTIHINTDKLTTTDWDEYYRKLDYKGKYVYLDHWVPTKDEKNAQVLFTPSKLENTITDTKKEDESGRVDPNHKKNYGFDWSKIQSVASKILNNPNLYAAGRLAGNLLANERIYDEYIKGIRPNLLQTYQTHRQVLGDEATKQAYYRRAAQGLTKAAQPFTSDADRQVAYMNEAKRVGDELRAQGDLADNQEIRRTSDESNQHQWANTQRATEVANTNLASLNKALADKHSILAQKHAANWSSVDNFLLGLETRNNQKIAERKAIQNLIDALEQYDLLNNNKNYQDALKAYNDYVAKNGDNFSTDIKLQELYKAVVNAKRNALKGWLNLQLISAKEGTKITYKKKDDLLYKTAKDTVDHFREMSKLLKRKRKDKQEIVKLAPHPKGSTRRYLLGGVAPFTVYKPAPLGGETTISSQGSTSSTKADKVDPKKESLDMIKKLFESVSAHGIPIDASLIYKDMNNFLAKSRLFGDELSTDDIASMYVNMMYKVNNLKFSGEVYNKAREAAANNAALNEYAVDASGNVVVLDKESKGIKLVELSEFLENRDKYTPLTNNMLLQMRAYNPEMAFRNGDNFMNNIVANGVGITKISEYIKNLIGTLGTNEEKIEGLSKIESGKVKEGIRIIDNLINAAPDGVYKLSLLDKTQKSLVEAAFRYVMGSLPILQKAILQLHASEVGMDLKDLILNRLTSNTGYTHNIEIDPLTGKAAKDANGNSKGDGNSENSAGLAFVLGLGPRELIDFNTGTSNAIRVLGIKGILLTHSKENLGQGATLLDATKSQQGGYLQWNKATFGGSKLNSQAYSHIILNDSTIVGMDLPYTKDINGNEVPDFLMAKKMELADLEILQNNIQNPGDKNKIYLKYGLPIKFDSNGNLNTMRYKRFAAIQVTLDEDSLLNKDAILSDEVAEAGEVERDLYLQTMKKSDKNYDLSDGMWITGWGKNQIYKGTIFVPYSEDIAFAALSSGEPFKQDLPDNAKSIQLMLYAPKISKYITPDKTLSQIKNN